MNPEQRMRRDAFRACMRNNLDGLESVLNEHRWHQNIIKWNGPHRGWTLLHVAAFNGNMEIVNMLLRKGVSSTAITPTMLYASDIARLHGHNDVAVRISQDFAEISAWHRQGGADLRTLNDARAEAREVEAREAAMAKIINNAFWNLRNGNTHRVIAMLDAMLLELHINKVNVRENNSWEWTFLHYAARAGNMAFVQQLLLRGASASARTTATSELFPAMTPAQVAREAKRLDVAVFLEAVERAELSPDERVIAEQNMAAVRPALTAFRDDL